jgi:hypothetical protein
MFSARKHGLWVILAGLMIIPGIAYGQTTQITTEYLMTLYAPLDPPQQIDNTLVIYHILDGGWVKGPKISGTLLAPAGDWIRVMPDGSWRLDVHATLKTDDGALIYLSYRAILNFPKESWDRLMKGEVLTAKDCYWISVPTMQTSAEKYAWLNRVQCIGKMVEVKVGEGSFVKYDIYIAR